MFFAQKLEPSLHPRLVQRFKMVVSTSFDFGGPRLDDFILTTDTTSRL